MLKLEVKGMKCEGCVSAVTNSLRDLDAQDISVSLEHGTASFEAGLDADNYIDALAEAGFAAIVAQNPKS